DRAVGGRRERDPRPVLGRVALLGERDAGPGRHERRVRRVVVERFHLEAEPVAVERDRRLEVGDGEDRPRAPDGQLRHQLWVIPASETIICPVTHPASSEARNATAGAMSSLSPRRGIAWSICTNSNASACGEAITPSDAVSPGATAFTAIPYLPSSRAAARVNP